MTGKNKIDREKKIFDAEFFSLSIIDFFSLSNNCLQKVEASSLRTKAVMRKNSKVMVEVASKNSKILSHIKN